MATADQIKSLIRSHFSSDAERFKTLALQVAAHEAQQGHGALATEIREILDQARRSRLSSPAILDLPPDLSPLVDVVEPVDGWAGLVLPDALLERIRKVPHEYLQRHKLKHHGLSHRRKLLLTGPPGTGKTMTARVLAHELKLPLMVVQVDRLVTRYMGETTAKLRQVFDLVGRSPGVYLFDEFDAIGGGRSNENDVGEMRRVLTALLQFIEQDRSDSIIVAATNSPELLDRALFRRFDDVLSYDNPDAEARRRLIGNALGGFQAKRFAWQPVLKESDGLSSAEVVQACRDALKEAVLADLDAVVSPAVVRALKERRHAHGGK